jgi:hypothetical protein
MADKESLHPDMPTPETLGGIYVCVEETEDLTVLPAQVPVHDLPTMPAPNGCRAPGQDPCLNLSVEAEEITIRSKTESKSERTN